jgi:seryl-tRNA synthetase
MLSNVYIARGERDGVAVMKVGKANNLRHRQKAIGITIEMSIPQSDEAAAFELENELRFFVACQWGKRLPGKNDWFYFDPKIYTALCVRVVELGGEAIGDSEIAALLTEYSESVTLKVEENDEDAEIAALQERYHRLLADEAKRAAEVGRRFDLEREERLKAEKAAKREHLAKLQRDLDELRKKFSAASERFSASHKEFFPQEIWDLNWAIVSLEGEIKAYRGFL